MIVLDKSRALDLMIARAERVAIPESFSVGFWLDPEPIVASDAAESGRVPELTNLLRSRPRSEGALVAVQD